MMGRASWRLSGHEQWTDFQEKQGASSTTLDFIVTPIKFQLWALICYWDHLKIFFAEITQGPSGMSIGTIWMDQKRFQGPPARGF